jgi:hypothetical protein
MTSEENVKTQSDSAEIQATTFVVNGQPMTLAELAETRKKQQPEDDTASDDYDEMIRQEAAERAAG